MKFKIQTLFALIFPFLSFAQDKGIDQIIDEKFGDATRGIQIEWFNEGSVFGYALW